MTIEKLHFKTSSGIKSIVGKDLITDKFVAIFELVKNSYDAGAKKVTITFDLDKITILDDGHGMSKDDLIEKWLNLAYSDKKEGKVNNDRAFVGSKGIGRFSADRLGTKLRISTKIANEEIFHRLEVDWDEFDKDLSTRFEEVNLDYSFGQSKKSKEESYTRIEISKLNENWTIDEVNKAKENLRRLKNPFLKNDGFKILVIDKNDLANSKEYIESNIAEVLKDKSITIEANFNENINVLLFDRGEKIFELNKKNDSILKKCPIDISINFLTFSAKLNFTRKMKIEPINFGNIFIYKNDFRVMPYGEIDFDTFGLNMRKTQGFSRYLGHREILGHISIKDVANSYFKEASSRDSGFVNNVYFDELKGLYLFYVHRILEAYVQLISWGELKGENEENIKEIQFSDANNLEINKFKNYISKRGEIFFFKENVSFEENKPEKKLEKIVKNISEKEKKTLAPIVQQVRRQVNELRKVSEQTEKIVREKNKDIELLERQKLNLLRKREESSYGEQLSHHLTTFTDRLDWVVQDLQSLATKLQREESLELCSSIQTVQRTKNELAIFKDILLKTSFDTRAKFNYDLREIIEWYSNEKKNIFKSLNIFILNNYAFNINCNIVELILMLDNFYNNAFEHGAGFIQFDFDDNDSLYISSDSEVIKKENFTRVFELGFSTKETGTGIGLNQIKIFLEKSGYNIRILDNSELVTFQIYKG